jgi:hypothetical protein
VRGEQYPSTALYFLIKDVVTLSIERLFDGMANMAVIGNVLFRRVDLRDTLQRLAKDVLWQEFDRLQDGDFAKHTDEKLVEQVVAKASMTPLEVAFDIATFKVEGTTVDVTGRFDYNMGGRPLPINGFRVTKAIPFKGDRQLWNMKPNPRGMNPPHGEIRAQELVIGKEVPEPEVDQAKQYIDEVVEKLREHLGYQEEQLQQHNDSLPDLTLRLVKQRRANITKAAVIQKMLNKC